MTNPGGIGNSVNRLLRQPSQALDGALATTQGLSNSSLPVMGARAMTPPLQTLVYSPNVKVIIASGTTQYDVSSDIVRCQLHRAESECATFWMTLSNPDYRYTPANGVPPFSRMDRIVVYMQSTGASYQVFSGYLDTVPYMQLYPGTVDFKATCTLKRLLYSWWNPSTPQSQFLMQQMSWSDAVSADKAASLDSGLGSMLRGLLHTVGGWPIANIHIQNFPTSLYEYFVAEVQKNQSTYAANGAAFQRMLLGDVSGAAPGASAGANANAGPPGAMGPGVAGAAGVGQTFYASQIIQACDALGLGPNVVDNQTAATLAQSGQTLEGSRNAATTKAGQQLSTASTQAQTANRATDAAILAVACSMVECGMRNLSNPLAVGSAQCLPNDGSGGGDGSSCGLFQQQNPWGTVQQRMNPLQAATMFFVGGAGGQRASPRSTGPTWTPVRRCGRCNGPVISRATSPRSMRPFPPPKRWFRGYGPGAPRPLPPPARRHPPRREGLPPEPRPPAVILASPSLRPASPWGLPEWAAPLAGPAWISGPVR